MIGQKEPKNLTKSSAGMVGGKSRKFATGNPGKIMPDFRHAVETMAESEGFGSSGRVVDTEITLSDDSCSPKRKCISLYGDSREQFWVPIQVMSFSKMTRAQKKELKVKLKRELEEVKVLHKRLASINMNSIVSPASDIRRFSDGLKRPLPENAPVVPERGQLGKKRLSPRRSGPHMNKPIEPPRQAVRTNSFDPFLAKLCSNLLGGLQTHKFGWVFKEPVDTVKLNIPDYFNVIKHPMDFSTIKTKLAGGEYTSPLGFAADVRLTFSNAMTYNPPQNNVHIMALALSKYFEQRWKTIEKKIPMYTDVPRLPSRVDSPIQNGVALDKTPPPKKKKVAPVGYTGKVEPVKRVMTDKDKHQLKTELESLLADLPESIIDFLKENSSGAGETDEDEIEIDIDALSDDVLFKLRKLLDDLVVAKKKQQSRAEPCEMELHNEPILSNSSIQPGRDIDAADEDIDIGGNDQPVSSFPPVEIVQDTADKNNRRNSPGTSSSGSGSSSSDSDSGSSSSESEGARTVPPTDKLKVLMQPVNIRRDGVRKTNLLGTLGATRNLDQHRSNLHEVRRVQSGSSLSQLEQTFHKQPPSAEVEGTKEGESAACERQVSPDKVYRAALLRNRFADTILKAQEKTLEKCEKRDPEKLRLEREELERRQREEKARLQAEAKAAEEARRKAEAEAVAEAKRKRDLEREAARLALQKMEKTVDINENCQFMEDLELLSAVPPDNLSSFMGNASPDVTQNGGLGSFIFRGNSNPLEQLGLYRKDDDEEEEEVEVHHSAPDPTVDDVEEGEID